MNQTKPTRAKASGASPAVLPADPAPMAANVHPLRAAGASKPVAGALQFDPAATLIRMGTLLELTGLGGRASVYRMLKEDPTFPRPVPLSDSTARSAPVAFVLGEVQQWIRARIAARGSAA